MNNDIPTSPQRMGLRGYVTHHEFAGMRIPAPVQNLVLRDYAARNKLVFELSIGEYFFPNCHVQLDGILRNLDNFIGVVMCSLFMLPKNAEHRHRVYQEFIRHDAALHLVFESLVIRGEADIDRAEDIIRFQSVLSQCPTMIPRELLPPLEPIDTFT